MLTDSAQELCSKASRWHAAYRGEVDCGYDDAVNCRYCVTSMKSSVISRHDWRDDNSYPVRRRPKPITITIISISCSSSSSGSSSSTCAGSVRSLFCRWVWWQPLIQLNAQLLAHHVPTSLPSALFIQGAPAKVRLTYIFDGNIWMHR